MKTIEIKDGLLLYEENWLSEKVADKLFEYLKKSVPWKQERGPFAPFPRLTSYYADKGVNYTYSGVTHPALEWIEPLEILRGKIQDIVKSDFNSLLLNYYRNGKDSIGWHTDAERELGENPIVPSVSLGETRTFCLRHKNGKDEGYLEFGLPHGSLLVMAGSTQHHWMHSVPKTKYESSERINLTFRNILRR